ncbi:uncharacterized protein LOC136071746 [Hydra vulgaris]|uniref:uncharacterized protein LOC136071746 n=1 Tax=Hydra vulgaris TaxID=6087 RepID=UPI0032E9E632
MSPPLVTTFSAILNAVEEDSAKLETSPPELAITLATIAVCCLTEKWKKVYTVAIKSFINGKFVCAEKNGNQSLIANKDSFGLWETFEICFIGTQTIALKSYGNGKFVSAVDTETNLLIANKDQATVWETFTLVPSFETVGFKSHVLLFLENCITTSSP